MVADDLKPELVTVLSANIGETGRPTGEEKSRAHPTSVDHREVMLSLVGKNQGQVMDPFSARFANPVDAVRCALEIQEKLKIQQKDLPKESRLQLQFGVHFGEVTGKEGEVHGTGVDVAVGLGRLEDGAGIFISRDVYEQVKDQLNVKYDYLGERSVRDLSGPVRTYRVSRDQKVETKAVTGSGTLKKVTNWLDIAKVIIMGLLALVGIVELWNAYTKDDHATKVEISASQKRAFPLPDKPSIAVLPFDNMTGDPEQEYFADGFTEQIITSLAKSSSLFVVARNSSFTYKGKPVKVQQVSEELGVRYVLEGSIQRSGGKVRINAQLIDALSGQHMWSERYDRNLNNIFSLQDEINLKILTALQVNLTTGEQVRAWAKGTKNLDAYLKLMQARENIYQMNIESNARARQLAEETIAMDPRYAEAYALKGATYYLDFWLGTSKSPKDSLAQAIEWNQKALTIDDSLASAHARLGYLYVITPPYRYEEGIASLEKAVGLDPNAAASYHFLAVALRFAGRPEEAIPMAKMAIRLEPFTPGIYYQNLGLLYLLKGDCEEAVKACEKGLELGRDNFLSYVMTTAVYASCSREEEAKRTANEVLRLNPKFTAEAFAKNLPYKYPEHRDQVIGGLQKAGL